MNRELVDLNKRNILSSFWNLEVTNQDGAGLVFSGG